MVDMLGRLRGSPDGALLLRVHSGSRITAISFGELQGVGERPEDPDGAGGVDAGPDLGLRVLRPHGAAPDLRVVEEEQLVVRHVQPRQLRLRPVHRHPLLVGSVGLHMLAVIIFTVVIAN